MGGGATPEQSMARAERAAPDHEETSCAHALASAFTAPSPSVEERMAAGKALRERVPRASYGAFERSPQVDALAILQTQVADTRLAFDTRWRQLRFSCRSGPRASDRAPREFACPSSTDDPWRCQPQGQPLARLV
jgi:hypothetical protein